MLFFFNNRFSCFCLSYTHTFIYFFKFAHSLFYSFALCQTISSLAISVSCRRFVLFYDFSYSKWFCRAWKYFVFVFSQYFRFLFSRNLDFFLKIFLLQTHFHCRFDSVIFFTAISFAAFIVVSCWVRFFFSISQISHLNANSIGFTKRGRDMCLYATLSFAKARELLSILIFFTKIFLYSQIYKYIDLTNDNALLRVCRYRYMDYMVYTYICASNLYFLLFLSVCACVWRL